MIEDAAIAAAENHATGKITRSPKEWLQFIEDIKSVVLDYGFEILEAYPSNRRNSLSYCIGYKHPDSDIQYSIVIELRISDHPLLDRNNQDTFHQYKLTEYQKLGYPVDQIKLVDIVINRRKLRTYENALNYVRSVLEHL